MSQNKIDKIADDIVDLKITAAKQNEILERLTDSVEYHIKRTDALEDLHAIIKEEMIHAQSEQKLTKALLESMIKSQEARATAKTNLLKNTISTAMATLGVVGAVLLALHELGILQKLF